MYDYNKLVLICKHSITMKCDDIKAKIRWLCDICFRKDQNNTDDELSTPLQQELPSIEPSHRINSPQSVPSKRPPLEQQAPPLQIKRIDTQEEKDQKPNMLESKKRQHSFKEEEFYSIDSRHMDSQKSMYDSSKLITQLSKIKKGKMEGSAIRRLGSKSSLYSSSQFEQTPNKSINVTDETNRLKDWLKKEYGKSRQVSFKINHAVRLKITGRGMINLLIHKLQDFYAHYMGESNMLGHSFFNKSKTVEALHIKNEVGASNYKRSRYMSFYVIRGYISNVSQILKILTSRNTMNILHSFSKVRVVQYEGGHLGSSLPLLEVQQDNKQLKQRKTYHIATQLSESLSGEDRQLLAANFSLDEGDESWIRAIRISVGLAGQIQIYTQSSQQIQQNERHFFEKRFNLFVKYLTQFNLISG